jgi:hypothetical protein
MRGGAVGIGGRVYDEAYGRRRKSVLLLPACCKEQRGREKLVCLGSLQDQGEDMEGSDGNRLQLCGHCFRGRRTIVAIYVDFLLGGERKRRGCGAIVEAGSRRRGRQ